MLFGASIKRVQLVSGRRFADQREGLSSSAFVDSAPGGQWRLVGSANHDRVSQGRTRYLEWSGKKCHTVCHDSEMQPTKVSENRSRRYQNRVGLRTTSLQQANRRGKGTHLQDIAPLNPTSKPKVDSILLFTIKLGHVFSTGIVWLCCMKPQIAITNARRLCVGQSPSRELICQKRVSYSSTWLVPRLTL